MSGRGQDEQLDLLFDLKVSQAVTLQQPPVEAEVIGFDEVRTFTEQDFEEVYSKIQAKRAEAQLCADAWNRDHGVGARVAYSAPVLDEMAPHVPMVTTGPAYLDHDGHAVIDIKDPVLPLSQTTVALAHVQAGAAIEKTKVELISDSRCTAPWQTEPDFAEAQLLLVVDARATIEQCWHAPKLRDRRTRSGLECGIIHGFSRALLYLLWKFKPTHCAVYMDDGAFVSRREIHPGYRPIEKPPSHAAQIPVCYEIAEALGLFSGARWADRFDVEACDAVATTVSIAPENWSVVVSTTDARLLQVAQRSDVRLTSWRSGEQETHPALQKLERRLGVQPHQVADVLSIVGDKHDGIPGVKGLGEVTARTLVKHYGSLEAIVAVSTSDRFGEESIRKVPGLRGAARVAQNLREGLDDVMRSFRLVELSRNLDLMPVDEWLSAMRRREYDWPALRRLHGAYEVPALHDLLK